MKPETRFRFRYFGRILLFAIGGFVLTNAVCLIYFYLS